ncbi:MAG: porin [Planctomycetaceae bacterium]|nr:porin [Planctomycetaceae bacterium]
MSSHYPVILFFGLCLWLNSVAGYAQQSNNTGVIPGLHFVSSEMIPTLAPVSTEETDSAVQVLFSDEQWGCQSIDWDFPMTSCRASCMDSSFRLFRGGSRLKFQGWVESGLYANSHGAKSQYAPGGGGLLGESGNGPNFGPGLRTTDYNMNQLWGQFSREMDCSHGLDWGFRADLIYGMNGYEVQSEDSFDHGWGQGDYGLGFHQLYGEVGYGKLSAKYGKFGTPIGWEEVPSWDNFFNSRSYCYNIEPVTHTGVLLHYRLTDGIKLAGGWAAGMENGFVNRHGDHEGIAGLELEWTQNSTLYYYMTQGRLNDSFGGGFPTDYFIQSLCFEWKPTDHWTYLCQYNLNNTNEVGGDNLSAYGINNHLIYRWNDRWGLGFRAEWFRDNGVLGYGSGEHSDYVELTLGLNYHPTEHLRLRPEIRYDRADKSAMFAGGTRSEQLSGGFALLYGF